MQIWSFTPRLAKPGPVSSSLPTGSVHFLIPFTPLAPSPCACFPTLQLVLAGYIGLFITLLRIQPLKMPRFSASLLLAVLVASAFTASATPAPNALRLSTHALARAGYVMPRAEEGEPSGGETAGDETAGGKGEGEGSEGEGGAQGGEGEGEMAGGEMAGGEGKGEGDEGEGGAQGGEGEGSAEGGEGDGSAEGGEGEGGTEGNEGEGGEGGGNAGFQLACDVGGVAGGLVTSGISLLSEIQGGELEENVKAQVEALTVILKASDEVGQQVLQACKDAGLIKGGEGEGEGGGEGEGAEGEAKAENGAARIALVGSSTTPTTPGGTKAATIVNNAVAQANALLAAPTSAVQASNVASSTAVQPSAIPSNAAAKSTQASRVGSLLLGPVVYWLLTAVVLW
ncbi:hypothetical protein MVEN_00711700 [Mycena venus]|uniref:Uncharacterized protein n=1 Tax=Mycena venus TaxID=2733690 RepID=A0A8H7D5S5_9AGAR|nr:hypothetical protein MVEN_00711700 [Mycena venus]